MKTTRLTGIGVALCSVWFALFLASAPAGATQQTYVNSGIISGQPPQVDAVNFVNYGSFGTALGPIESLSGFDLYKTSSTLNFTNQAKPPGAGVMYSQPGFIFDLEPVGSGFPKPSASFYNIGHIEALDPVLLFNGLPSAAIVGPSKLFITATNVINHGQLVTGPNGWLKVTGTNVDLSNGSMEVKPIGNDAQGSTENRPAGFFAPDVGIGDIWFAAGIMSFNSAFLWNGASAQTPTHQVTTPLGLTVGDFFSVPGPGSVGYADSYEDAGGFQVVTITNLPPIPPNFGTNQITNYIVNVVLLSNVVKQAIFVGVPADISVSLGFRPSSSPTNLMQTTTVLLSLNISNSLTTLSDESLVYLEDQLAAEPGRGLLQNLIVPDSFRPTNYLVSRLPLIPQVPGNPGFGVPDPDFFVSSGQIDTNVSFDTITNADVVLQPYAAYAAFIDNVVSEPALLPSGTVTNLPGRAHVFSKTLDLTKARIRGEGEIVVNTPHLISSTNAILDCQNLSLNLGNTNGNLLVQNLTKESVARLRGTIDAWSATWQNASLVIITNNYMPLVDTNGIVTNRLQVPLTNTITTTYHVLMLDASALETLLPVNVYDFVTHSTNVTVNDKMRLVQDLNIDAKAFTLNGSMTFATASLPSAFAPAGFLSVSLNDWVYTNAPNLLFFTNNGTLAVANEAHFGDDRAFPYSSFVNTGTLSGASIALNSSYFQINGSAESLGPVFMQGDAGKVEKAIVTAGGDVTFQGLSVKFLNAQVQSAGVLTFDVTGSLFDAGPTSSNVFNCGQGINLLEKPATGDLLGSIFNDKASTNVSLSPFIQHTWVAEDRGATSAGYLNDVALGKLVLASDSTDPTFFFSGAGLSGITNALYVDLLDLTAISNHIQSWITINPDLVIYYAAANLGFTPPPVGGLAQEPEEYLDGQFGGHLRWVRTYAGANSSVSVVVNGQTVSVNRALRFSKIIDSDGDGIPNFYDLTPFGVGPVPFVASISKTNLPSPAALAISWQALSNTIYEVDYATNAAMGWHPLAKFTNTAATNKVVSVLDANGTAGGVQRFYRISYSP